MEEVCEPGLLAQLGLKLVQGFGVLEEYLVNQGT